MDSQRRLTHLDESGRAVMVDVSGKAESARTARAGGEIRMSPEALEALSSGSTAKGDVLALARAAGILAVKSVPSLIPLCHHTRVSSAVVEFERSRRSLLHLHRIRGGQNRLRDGGPHRGLRGSAHRL